MDILKVWESFHYSEDEKDDYTDCNGAAEMQQVDQVENDPLQLKAVKMEDCDDTDLLNLIKSEPRRKSSRRKRPHNSTTDEGNASNDHNWTSDSKQFDNFISGTTTTDFEAKCKGPATNAASPLETWHLLFDDEMLKHMKVCMNEEISKRKSGWDPQRPTTNDELFAWIGLNYLCGIFRNVKDNGPIEELWSCELGNAIFGATMSMKRFTFLSGIVKELCKTKAKAEKFTKVFVNKFVINCRSYFEPGKKCVIGQHAVGGNEAFQLVMLCDESTLFMCNAVIGSKSQEADVQQLVCDIQGSQRTIAFSEHYLLSLAVGEKLRSQQLNLLATLSPTDVDIPKDFSNKITTTEMYKDNMCLSKIDIEKMVLAAGTPCDLDTYNSSLKSFEEFQRFATLFGTRYAYKPETATLEWLCGFQLVLDYAAFNAWILLSRLAKRGNPSMTQRDFQRRLGLLLTQAQLKHRLREPNRLTLSQKLKISEILGEPTDSVLAAALENGIPAAVSPPRRSVIAAQNVHVPGDVVLQSKLCDKRWRCRKCRGTNSPKTRFRCQQCLRPLCHRHLVVRCDDCTGVNVMPAEIESEAAATMEENST